MAGGESSGRVGCRRSHEVGGDWSQHKPRRMKEQQAEDGDSNRLRRGCCFMCVCEGVGWDFFCFFWLRDQVLA